MPLVYYATIVVSAVTLFHKLLPQYAPLPHTLRHKYLHQMARNSLTSTNIVNGTLYYKKACFVLVFQWVLDIPWWGTQI